MNIEIQTANKKQQTKITNNMFYRSTILHGVTGVSDSLDRMTPQSLAPKNQMEKMTPLVNICKGAHSVNLQTSYFGDDFLASML